MLSQTQLEIIVRYDAPVREARRVLRVLPLRRAGQTVRREAWRVNPAPDGERVERGASGRFLALRHARIEREWRLQLELEVETSGEMVPEAAPDLVTWKMPSRAVALRPELQDVARAAKDLAPLERAAHFNRFCFLSLDYAAQTSAEPPSCGAVWELKRGNCADFAHVFLSLCRASGLAARYVAGFNPMQGQMHAWAEIWNQGFWHAFDPTHGRAPAPGSVAVAVGRDFFDCAPHTGTYRGAASAHLSLFCRTQLC